MGNIFKRFKAGDPLAKAVNQSNFDTVYNILEETEGEGCDIERNNPNGKGWIIKVPETTGDADADTASVKSSSVTVEKQPEDDDEGSGDEDGTEVKNVISLKGFKDEDAVTGEDFDSENSDVLIRDRTDEDKPELKYVPTAEITKADTEAEETQLSRSIGHNENGELALKGFQSESTTEDITGHSEVDILVRDRHDGVPELKYITCKEASQTDSEADQTVSKSMEHDSAGDLTLFNFAANATATVEKNPTQRAYYHLLVRYTYGKELTYLKLDDAVMTDAEANYPTSETLEKGDRGLRLLDFLKAVSQTVPKTTREKMCFVLRDWSSTPPKLNYGTIPSIVPADTEGSASKSVERNTNDELSLYHFSNPSGGTIDKDNKDDYYVFCRSADGNTLLQRKLDFGSGDDDEDDDEDGYTGSVDVVTDVTYSASTHRLEKKIRTFIITNGRITDVHPASIRLIDQAVEETV